MTRLDIPSKLGEGDRWIWHRLARFNDLFAAAVALQIAVLALPRRADFPAADDRDAGRALFERASETKATADIWNKAMDAALAAIRPEVVSDPIV